MDLVRVLKMIIMINDNDDCNIDNIHHDIGNKDNVDGSVNGNSNSNTNTKYNKS